MLRRSFLSLLPTGFLSFLSTGVDKESFTKKDKLYISYIKNVYAFTQKQECDEEFMKSAEEQFDIKDSAFFRNKLINFIYTCGINVEKLGLPEQKEYMEYVEYSDSSRQDIKIGFINGKKRYFKLSGHYDEESWFDEDGRYHREDGPARINPSSTTWMNHGQCHRIGGPAIIYASGQKRWMQLGMLHREDGPAIEEENGTNIWYFNNKPHRAAGPACEYTNGTKEWYFHGNLHREDGPAVIMRGGYKAWHKHGLQHRVGGPAVEWSNGVKEYWENDKLLYTQCKGIVYNPKVKIVGPCTSLMSMDLKTNKIVIHKNKC